MQRVSLAYGQAQYLVGFLVSVTQGSPHLPNSLGNVTY